MNITKLLLIAIFLVFIGPLQVSAGRWITRTGKVTFFSATPMENIEARNNETAAVLDDQSGDVMIKVPIKSFKFEQALMEEHFNENYMESNKYPIAEFKGRVTNISSVNLAADGVYNIVALGTMVMHGVSRTVTMPGTITVAKGSITAAAKFTIHPSDFNISIPSLVAGKIAKNIETKINAKLQSVNH